MNLSSNYRSSEKVIAFFAPFNVHQTAIEAASEEKDYASIISYNTEVHRDALEDELVRLIKFNVETKGIAPHEICVLAPWWTSLAGMTRRLAARMPEFDFDGPGMVPFGRDVDNFWYKVARIALSRAAPGMFVRRLRWAAEVIARLDDVGALPTGMTGKAFLRLCNSIQIDEAHGLPYLDIFFETLFQSLKVEALAIPALKAHYDTFFESANARIHRMKNEGGAFIETVLHFRRMFDERRGITISTVHGIKGDEYDSVIAYALLQGMVPNFGDPDQNESAMKLLYVICSRARKNIHLISEKGRMRYGQVEYAATTLLSQYEYAYDLAE